MDEDSTSGEAVITEDSVSGISPGGGPHIEFKMSTGGLDFMSSSGYLGGIEFAEDSESGSEEESDDEEEDSTSPDDQGPNGGGGHGRESVSGILTALTFLMYFEVPQQH